MEHAHLILTLAANVIAEKKAKIPALSDLIVVGDIVNRSLDKLATKLAIGHEFTPDEAPENIAELNISTFEHDLFECYVEVVKDDERKQEQLVALARNLCGKRVTGESLVNAARGHGFTLTWNGC